MPYLRCFFDLIFFWYQNILNNARNITRTAPKTTHGETKLSMRLDDVGKISVVVLKGMAKVTRFFFCLDPTYW